MIIINETRLGRDLYVRWHRERVAACPGHVWTRAPSSPAWTCTLCPAWGRIR